MSKSLETYEAYMNVPSEERRVSKDYREFEEHAKKLTGVVPRYDHVLSRTLLVELGGDLVNEEHVDIFMRDSADMKTHILVILHNNEGIGYVVSGSHIKQVDGSKQITAEEVIATMK